MNELDVVSLQQDYKNLKVNTKGVVVLKYNNNDFEVEFFDSENHTIGVYTVSRKYLRKEAQ